MSPRMKIESPLWKVSPVKEKTKPGKISSLILDPRHPLLEEQSWLSEKFIVLNGEFSPSEKRLRLELLPRGLDTARYSSTKARLARVFHIHFEKGGKAVQEVSLESKGVSVLPDETFEALNIACRLFSHILPHQGYRSHFNALSEKLRSYRR